VDGQRAGAVDGARSLPVRARLEAVSDKPGCGRA